MLGRFFSRPRVCFDIPLAFLVNCTVYSLSRVRELDPKKLVLLLYFSGRKKVLHIIVPTTSVWQIPYKKPHFLPFLPMLVQGKRRKTLCIVHQGSLVVLSSFEKQR